MMSPMNPMQPDIETAIATTPEACFAAFALSDESIVSHSDIMISHNGKKWMPVDLRNPQLSFDNAVVSALSTWNNLKENQKEIFPLKRGREIYFNPSPPAKKGTVKIPKSDDIVESYLNDIKSYLI